jgi:Zn-dependent M28 family amino/carboxypeptidase
MLAAAAATLALMGGAEDPGYAFARSLALAGPRPAAGAAEKQAHGRVAEAFRAAGLTVAHDRFAVARSEAGRRSRNVIGVVARPRACLWILMAHADTVPPSPGAEDNASGVGTLVALAPRVAALQPACDVWLVATGAEERIYTGSPDHLGALALARRARAHGARRRLQWALSLDEVGRDRPFWLRSPVSVARPKVEGALLDAAASAGVPVSWVRDESTGNSDHREFQLLGLPAAKLGVGAGGEPCRHMACDRSSRLDPKSLVLARRMTAAALRAR